MKRNYWMALLAPLLFTLAACGPGAHGGQDPDPPTPVAVQAQLAGDNEVPAVATTATGTVSATLTGSMLEVSGAFEGMLGDLVEIAGSSAHIHAGGAGENGPVVLVLDVDAEDERSGTLSGEFELDDAQRQMFLDGRMYVNVHTELYPGGELRAQLMADAPTFDAPDASFMTDLTADAIVTETGLDLGGATPMGQAVAILRGDVLIASGSFEGLSSALRDYVTDGIDGRPDITEAIHIHEAMVGENGPFVVQFDVDAGDDMTEGSFRLMTELDAAQRQALLTGMYYVDIHTVMNPAGELRGQLFPERAEATATLSGDEEVAEVPVVTDATGTVTAALVGDTLTVMGSFEGLSGMLMDIGEAGPAHIHVAPRGVNGPVVFPLDVEADEGATSGSFSLETELDAEQKADFLAGRYYVNFHTEAFGAGEIRAQLEPFGVSIPADDEMEGMAAHAHH